nr:uncharacterized protein LOC126056028 [Helicoverpa armigera]
MESLLYKQEDTYNRICKAYSTFRKSPKDRITAPYVKVRLENLEKMYEQLTDGHNKLLEGYDPDKLRQSQYVQKDVYNITEETYMQYKIELEIILESFESKEETKKESKIALNSKQCHVKLPKIVIPVFSGKYTDWVTFRDLFVSLIHKNPSLDNVQRMQYLKGYLSGEAEQLLRQIPISDANYEHCWQLLNSRYNNKRYLSHFILKRLLSQRNLTSESAFGLKELIDNTNDCLKALVNLGIDVKTWDIIVIHIITLKLDPESRKQWEFNITSNNSPEELPTFAQFTEFLTNRYRALEFLDNKPGSSSKGQSNYSGNTNKVNSLHVTGIQCPCCSESHKLSFCKQFYKMDCDARRSFVQQKGICFNCLGKNHSAKECNSIVKCKICKRRHHSLLHPQSDSSSSHSSGRSENNNSQASTESSSVKEDIKECNMVTKHSDSHAEEAGQPLVTCFSTGTSNHTVLLATALIRAESKAGVYQVVRALIDQGSQVSLVTEATVQYLGLKKIPSTHVIKGVGGDKEITSRSVVIMNVKSRVDSNFNIKVKAYVLKSITSLLPVTKVNAIKWVDLQNEQLADPQYHTPNKINVLLGADVYRQIIEEGLKRNSEGSVIAQCSKLGWILSGVVDTSISFSSNLVVLHAQVDDNEALKRFWELEAEPTNQKKIMSEEEKQCEELFAATTKRDENGRYVVRLPFREQSSAYSFGEFEEIAERRLNSLHGKLKKDPDLKERYKQVINEYLELGHMEKVPEAEKGKRDTIYLPHHAVVREDKDTTKVRVVFDASCKCKKGYSLNDKLMIGPKLQPELRHLLMRWRKHPICMAADIVKMYRQVRVADVDKDNQRILWKEEPENNAETYRMLRVTFGTASAPYLAVKALQQVAHDEGKDYPAASRRVISDFYMDDLLTGCSNIEEGLTIYREMNELLSKAGFEIQKWMTNNVDLLKGMKESNKIKGVEGLQLKEDEVVKVLGLIWNQRTDNFRYAVNVAQEPGPVTKRKIISHIAKLYDPLGWVAPCVITAKIIIQKLWLAGLNWDEEVSNQIITEWDTYLTELVQLAKVEVPRWHKTNTDNNLVELHGFSDASKLAYAAVVYLRVVDTEGNTHVSLVTAKTKVAPIKQVSIPRLELCGAVLLTKLLVEVATVMEIPIKNVRAWTDSTVVLAWLNSHPSRWQLTQKMMQNFWHRWSQEYLKKFLHRYKWSSPHPEPEIGDIVVVREDDLPPCKWLLAKVVEKHPVMDKITRVVTLRTKNSLIKRPTSKICILPVTQ